MSTITKHQKKIITIFIGNSYSTFRDNNLAQLKTKAKKYLNEVNNKQLKKFGGGWALMIMENAISGNLKQNGKNVDDETKKLWLSIAIGFELTCTQLQTIPKFLLSLIRLFAAPSINNKKFSSWVNQHNEKLSAYMTLIDGLDDLKKDNDVYKIIFKNN